MGIEVFDLINVGAKDVGTGGATLYTVPSTPTTRRYIVTELKVCNNLASPTTYTITVNDTSLVQTRNLFKDIPIPDGATDYITDRQILAPGDVLAAVAGDASAVDINVSIAIVTIT